MAYGCLGGLLVMWESEILRGFGDLVRVGLRLYREGYRCYGGVEVMER